MGIKAKESNGNAVKTTLKTANTIDKIINVFLIIKFQLQRLKLIVPVSYTHLDVYKRQVVNYSSKKKNNE